MKVLKSWQRRRLLSLPLTTSLDLQPTPGIDNVAMAGVQPGVKDTNSTQHLNNPTAVLYNTAVRHETQPENPPNPTQTKQ